MKDTIPVKTNLSKFGHSPIKVIPSLRTHLTFRDAMSRVHIEFNFDESLFDNKLVCSRVHSSQTKGEMTMTAIIQCAADLHFFLFGDSLVDKCAHKIMLFGKICNQKKKINNREADFTSHFHRSTKFVGL